MFQQNVRERLGGVVTALVTPMKGGELDVPAFEAHIDRQLEAGVSCLSPIGTTGEAATLTEAETAQLINTVVRRSSGRAFVIAGAGSNSTRIAIDKARKAADLGADGLLVVVPYFSKPSQAGIVDHFSAIADAVRLPILVYNVPGRVGTEISIQSCVTLLRSCVNIVGFKEAGGNTERITRLRLALGDDPILLTGDDTLALPLLAVGVDGVYSVASNLLPVEMLSLYRAWKTGKPQEALAIHRKLYEVMDNLFIESNPVPVKAAMARRRWIQAEVRAPLAPLTPENWSTLEKSIVALED